MRPEGGAFSSSPVSRVLSWTVIPLGMLLPTCSSNLPADSASHVIVCLFGLASDGVYPPPGVTTDAVRSYRTFSPLPVLPCSHRRFTFCCTFHRLATSGR